MKEFPENIKFKYSWRKYQQRVLDELQEHLSNRHLHVIAPPGSGKTVLGLEVALRLNQPTLILSPTLTIRNQWIQRFCELFLQTTVVPDWISKDIRNPKFMTVITYQGLHAACNNLSADEQKKNDDETKNQTEIINGRNSNENLNNIVKVLLKQGIKTVILDEAHHLKNEWWQTLTRVKDQLDPVIVGLTATPPYDVTFAEWQRYLEMNGPVDAEITTPELVAEGDLCPHQDYVHFTFPTNEEQQSIVDFRLNINKLAHEIQQDTTLANAIESHPVWGYPLEHLDWIYTNLSCYSACLIFLNAIGRPISEVHLEIIGDKKLKIPPLAYDWIEVLLDFYLYKEKEHFAAYDEHRLFLENKLKKYGAVEKRQISFSYNKRVTGFLTSSISKLNGIQQIVDFEYSQMGSNLRMVILSDFIRKEFFVNTPQNNLPLNKIGIIPIFEKLRRESADNRRIGVLTGSIVIIPQSAYPAFEAKSAKRGILNVSFTTVPYDDRYIVINQTEQLNNSIVQIITHIFQEGEIEILIGTKSLLGEGWDAPAINSLVLASFVGSFVLSNQMRGRAIRTEKGNNRKTGNIWHLACLDPTSETGGDDIELLKRRFKGFVGISLDEKPCIENGISRLNIPENMTEPILIEGKNTEMFRWAADRASLQQRWNDALAGGVNLVEEIKVPFPDQKEYRAVKSMYLTKTIANLLIGLSFMASAYLEYIFQMIARMGSRLKTPSGLYFLLFMILIGGAIIFGRQGFKTLWIYFKYRDIAKDIRNIGDALVNSLFKAGIIRTDLSKLNVVAEADDFGAVYCHLEGGTTFEKSTFIDALNEIVSPIDNPRYVIIRKSKLMLFVSQQDYHTVPEALGRNKNLAEYFANQWTRLVGTCKLVFTRTIDGRKMLLKSRVKSLSAQFEKDNIERVNKWK